MALKKIDLIIVEIDLSQINNSLELHKKLKQIFEFPNFYGNNLNALIDCWTDLRNSGESYDSMCNIYLNKNELLVLQTKNLSLKSDSIVKELICAIEEVNKRLFFHFEMPTISILTF